MASRSQTQYALPGDILLVIRKYTCANQIRFPLHSLAHGCVAGCGLDIKALIRTCADRYSADDFKARSGDELSLARGDKIALIERDDDFGDGWFLGRHVDKEETGLFPEGA